MKLSRFLPILALFGLFLAACGGATPTPVATDVPPVVTDTSVVAEGKLVPYQFANLAFNASGKLAELLVSEGDVVEEGAVLARLENTEAMAAEVLRAEEELRQAQQALDDLYEDVEPAKAQELQAIANAYEVLKDAEYKLDIYTIPSNQAGMTAMEAVEKMRVNLNEAQAAFEPYKHREQGNSTRRDLKKKLDNAQSDFNSAVRRMTLEAEVAQAESNLAEAKKNYDALQGGPLADEVATAEARIKNAEAALGVTQAAFDSLELKAPFSGSVADLNLKVGEFVSLGTPVVTLADFSSWAVETQDLTEIEVIKIEPGQTVSVILDALPDEELVGTVEKIRNTSEERQGDVTYTIKIGLDDFRPEMRWGMTAEVEFAK